MCIVQDKVWYKRSTRSNISAVYSYYYDDDDDDYYRQPKTGVLVA